MKGKGKNKKKTASFNAAFIKHFEVKVNILHPYPINIPHFV